MVGETWKLGTVVVVVFCIGFFSPVFGLDNAAEKQAQITLPADTGKSEPPLNKEVKPEPVKKEASKKELGWKIGDLTITGVNTLRYESWDTFLPKASTLDKDYNFTADRLALTFKYQKPWTTFTMGLNAVKFFGLPKTGSGGVGQTYYAQSGTDSDFSKLYIHSLNFTFKRVGDPGMSATIGRFAYSNGTEFKGENAKVEWVKTMRVADRVLGPFGWTYYQRSMNGVMLKRDNGRFQAAASAWYPTAGGFSKQAGDVMEDVRVMTLAGTFKFNKYIPNQELQVFAYNYDDDRSVVGARGDNSVNASGTPLTSRGGVDVSVRTYGLSLVGAYDHLRYVIDTMLWAVFQTGDWYNLDHKASAFAVEAGYQWKKSPWAPWVRIGLNQSSGDGNPGDGKHGTFFQMLPTARQYSWSTTYNLMNTKDAFIQLILKPHPKKLVVRTDYHRLRLTEGADRWYFGGGATADSGAVTGFGARNTLKATDLGSVIEMQGTYTFNKEFNATLYMSRFSGGSAARNVFAAEQDQNFSYLEVVYNF